MKLRPALTLAPRADESPTTDQLVLSVASDVRHWCFRYLGPKRDLDDAVQEALLAIAKAAPSFRGKSQFRTFAYRITMRSAARWARRHRKESHTSLELVSDPRHEDDPEVIALRRDELRGFYSCLEKLSPKLRRALVLFCLDGLSYADDAALEGCGERAFRARVVRGRAQLEALVAQTPSLARFVRSSP